MFTYNDDRMLAVQKRFGFLRSETDRLFGAIPTFIKNHRSEIYKSVLKSLSMNDHELVSLNTTLACERFPGKVAVVYTMLHLPKDTNEQGNWHRDGVEPRRRVFWIPMTQYKYTGISVVPWSSGVLSSPATFLGSRGLNLSFLSEPIDATDKKFFAWSPRMVHRGNLNISNELSAAMVICVDQDFPASARELIEFDHTLVSRYILTVKVAITFDPGGMVLSIDKSRLAELNPAFVENLSFFFKIRTGRTFEEFFCSQK